MALHLLHLSRGLHAKLVAPLIRISKNILFYSVSHTFHQTLSLPPQCHSPPHPSLPQFLQLLKRVSHSSSPASESITLLDDSGFQANRDLICSAIWALREEWKAAFVAFNWGNCYDDEKVCNLMIWVLGTHAKFSTAWSIIGDMHRSSISTRQAMLIMIDRYAAANNATKAIQTFNFMEKFRLALDQEAFYALLTSLCKHENVEEAEEFMLANKKLFPLETEGFNIILNGWCNITTDIFEAKRVWREMPKYCITSDATSYSHMISCFSKIGNLFDSLRLYDEMKRRGWIPTIEVYNSLVYVLTRENCLKEAIKVVDKMKEEGLQPDSTTFNSMIRPLCEAGKLAEARIILNTLLEENLSPTTETYHAFLEVTDYQGTLEFLSKMKGSGLGPNEDSFLIILAKFLKLKQHANAVKIWMEMKKCDVVPSCMHFKTMVEGLVACRWFIKARDFYEEMISNGCSEDPKLKMIFQKELVDSGGKGKQNVKKVTSY
ncbi:PREDICTED: pentatricopeptide repeat-containing protein At1g80880, mitochondrial [Lupinus angustifolius]|uniref:pentatricopeptide repeat-containing protein At1g80880, mitochondrial n=1 Tax=Lupinus angustifolius TaxID=3871 RepID=UPI00092ECB29|nr:PREDICTED: pentatricopeptide repeat-containing protein At1g80880, mitochondrial [Lupinus angustifolius]